VSILEPRPPTTTHRSSCPHSVYAPGTRAPRQPRPGCGIKTPRAWPEPVPDPDIVSPIAAAPRLRDLPRGRQPPRRRYTVSANRQRAERSLGDRSPAIRFSRHVGHEAWRAQIVVRRPRAVRSRQGPLVHREHRSGWGCCSPPLLGLAGVRLTGSRRPPPVVAHPRAGQEGGQPAGGPSAPARPFRRGRRCRSGLRSASARKKNHGGPG
jgi:hypothetical protein